MPKFLTRAITTPDTPTAVIASPASQPPAFLPTRRFLSLGAFQAVALDAIVFFEEASSVLSVQLRGRQTLVSRTVQRSQLQAVLIRLIGDEVVIGEHAPSPGSSVQERSEAYTAQTRRLEWIRFAGKFSSGDVVVALGSIDAYELKGETLRLHLQSGETKVVTCRDPLAFQQAIESIYGSVLEVKDERWQHFQQLAEVVSSSDPNDPMGHFLHVPRRL